MIRDRRDFESLIWDLERSARENPRQYKSRVAMLALLGYAYIFGLLALLIGSLFIVVLYCRWTFKQGDFWGVHIAVGAGVAFWLAILVHIVVDALMIELKTREGADVRRDAIPAFFQMLDELCARFRVPKFDHVTVTRDFNAGVMQRPQYGFFGRNINYLQIGIPLMKAVTPDQFKSVLAHELGHISGDHSRFSIWIQRSDAMWMRLLNELKSNTRLIGPFVRWYAPYFDAYSFALRRQNEYEADKSAAEVAGSELVASSLVATNSRGPYLPAKFWPSVYEQAARTPRPQAKPLTTMFTGEAVPSRRDQEIWYRQALDEKSDVDDTHPCLTDRLGALGYRGVPAGKSMAGKPPYPLPDFPAETAAERYLGRWLDGYMDVLDNGWAIQVADVWMRHYAEAHFERADLAEHREGFANGTLDREQSIRFVKSTFELEGSSAGIAAAREYLARFPDDAEGHYTVGVWMLDAEDEAGIEDLQRSMGLDPKRRVRVCGEIAAFYRLRGDLDKATPYEAYVKQNARYDDVWSAPKRVALRKSDRFVYHALSPDLVERVRGHLNKLSHVRGAYLVQRMPRENPDRPLFVVVIEPMALSFESMSDVDLDQVAFEAERGIELPGDLVVEFAYGRTRWLKRAVSELASARIIWNG